MSPATRQLIREIAQRHNVDADAVLSHYGPRTLSPARAEVTRAMKARGYSISHIARLLQRDRHTIYHWLDARC